MWLGRRDGRESHAAETKQLPPPKASLPQLIAMFAVKGLDLKDLVVLSGKYIFFHKLFGVTFLLFCNLLDN